MPFKLEEYRISLISFLILMTLTVISGISVYAVMQHQAESTLNKSLEASLRSGIYLFSSQIQQRTIDAKMIATRPFIADNLSGLAKGSTKSRQHLERSAESFVQQGLAGVSFFDAYGREVAHAGRFHKNSATQIPIAAGSSSYLVWDGQFMLHERRDIVDPQQRRIGSVIVESSLDLPSDSMTDIASIGKTSEFALCSPLPTDPQDMDCFLREAFGWKFQHLHRIMSAHALPMDYALKGKTGIIYAKDYRGVRVVAAYAPLHKYKMGAVLKIDQSELYSPVTKQLKYISLLLAFLVMMGGLLLHWMMTPLVKQLFASRLALQKENEKSRALLYNASDGIHIIGMDGYIIDVSKSFCDMLGYSSSELMEMNLLQWDAKLDSSIDLAAELERRFSRHERMQFEGLHRRKNGSVFPVEVSTFPLLLGGKPALFCSSRDITERKQISDHLKLTSSVFDHADEGILITDKDGTILEANPACSSITGYSHEEMIGNNPRILHSGRQDKQFYETMWHEVAANGYWSGEIWNKRKSGEIFPERLTLSSVKNEAGETIRFIALFSDISNIKTHQQQLEHLAHHDALTGLPNRILLNDRLEMALAKSNRSAEKLAVCFMDLDGFKPVNDNFGHDAGDALLVEVAQRMLEISRSTDTIARLGGDEFVLIFTDISGKAECQQMLTRVMNAINLPFDIGGHEIRISASIGVALYPDDDGDGDSLLRHADQAMYVAKQSGRGRFHFFNASTDRA